MNLVVFIKLILNYNAILNYMQGYWQENTILAGDASFVFILARSLWSLEFIPVRSSGPTGQAKITER